MIRGQRPKPAHLKLVTGNPGNRPINHDEPKSPPLGKPSKHLTPKQRAMWLEIAGLAPKGVLGESDRMNLEMAADLMLKFRSGDYGMPLVAQLRQLFGSFGMDPCSRARLSVPSAAPANPFEDL